MSVKAGVAVRWATRERAMDLTGIPEATLLRLVNDGLVGCRKSGADQRARTVFCVPDIEDWWDDHAEVVREFRV